VSPTVQANNTVNTSHYSCISWPATRN